MTEEAKNQCLCHFGVSAAKEDFAMSLSRAEQTHAYEVRCMVVVANNIHLEGWGGIESELPKIGDAQVPK